MEQVQSQLEKQLCQALLLKSSTARPIRLLIGSCFVILLSRGSNKNLYELCSSWMHVINTAIATKTVLGFQLKM